MPPSEAPVRSGEFALIAKLFAPLASNMPGAFGLTDDAALLPNRTGRDRIITADAIVEGVHFLPEDPPDAIAQKALRVNLSDLAAKGAEPEGYLLSLMLPAWPDDAWLEAFAAGLAADQAEFAIALIGGDTCATSGPLAIAITAFGTVPEGAMIRRAGARVGDCVFVSGTIGDAGGGLALLQGEGTHLCAEDRERLIARYRRPLPRLRLGVALRGLASAALDVSDGLIGDLAHIAETSHVQLAIDAARIPLSGSFRALCGDGPDAWRRAAAAGDDYEIAFTAAPEQRDTILAAGARTGVAVTEIGRAMAGEGVVLRGPSGAEIAMPHKGFVHF